MMYRTRPLTDAARARLAGVTPRPSPFSAKWRSTLELLDTEMRAIGARGDEFVMQIDVTEADMRLDGTLRASAKPKSPSVAIAVETRRGPLLFVCGQYWDWQDNVRAIALTMQALRAVDRYGAVQANEQYTGFRALGSGQAMGPVDDMSTELAAKILADASGGEWLRECGRTEWTPELLHILQTDAEQVRLVWKVVAKSKHPDAGGDAVEFARARQAKDVLLRTIAAMGS